MFEDRTDAGKKLARALEEYRDEHVVVLAIPRGGVEVAYQVAKYLNGSLSIVVSRKLPFPDNPESGFGAVAEDGSTFLIKNAAGWVRRDMIEQIIEEQKREITRRIEALRNNEPLPELEGKIVMLIDDGIAMGSTMRAAIALCKNARAKKIIVAVPVAGKDVAREIGRQVDKVVVLETPVFFQAVAQVYRNWYDVPDREVKAIMERWRREKQAESEDANRCSA